MPIGLINVCQICQPGSKMSFCGNTFKVLVADYGKMKMQNNSLAVDYKNKPLDMSLSANNVEKFIFTMRCSCSLVVPRRSAGSRGRLNKLSQFKKKFYETFKQHF